MIKIINIIAGLFSFIFGFFIAKKIGEAEKLKMQVQNYEKNKKEQEEIIARNIDASNVSSSAKRLWLKSKRNKQ